MAAVIDFHTGSAVPEPDRPTPGPADRPTFEVIEGGRSPAALRQQRIYLRRRIAVLLVVAVVALSAVRILPAIASGSSSIDTDTPTALHRVERGDTLWSVAGAVDPSADPRDVIDRIVALNASTSPDGRTVAFSPDQPLRVGQELVVPAPVTAG